MPTTFGMQEILATICVFIIAYVAWGLCNQPKHDSSPTWTELESRRLNKKDYEKI